jgi:hypothetical protein
MRVIPALLLSLFAFLSLAAAQADFRALARDGSLTDVLAALRAGASVSAADEYGQTPLMYAASGNQDPQVHEALVVMGANIDARSGAGWTALMYAARDNPNPAVLLKLLELRADARATNSEGRNALWYATQNPNLAGSTALTRLQEASVPPHAPTPAAQPTTQPAAQPAQRSCCRVCRTGKACGNSCINRSYTCRQGPGCACNADIGTDDSLIADEERFFSQLISYELGDVMDSGVFGDCEMPGYLASVLVQ